MMCIFGKVFVLLTIVEITFVWKWKRNSSFLFAFRSLIRNFAGKYAL